jgi:7-cyano-7-deazaguanine synthase
MSVESTVNSDDEKKAVVLLSGGLDSAVVLRLAQTGGYDCYALSVQYGQRHSAELQAAKQLAMKHNAREHKIIELDLRAIGGSALTADIDVPETMEAGIPVTYVPARNTVFLSLALAYAEVIGARHLFIGVNAVDYSGYPDCRPVFVEAFERLANVATKAAVEGARCYVHAPLIDMSKADIIRAGLEAGVDFADTVSCYQADEMGRACGVCDACRLRAAGFQEAQVEDPTRYR